MIIPPIDPVAALIAWCWAGFYFFVSIVCLAAVLEFLVKPLARAIAAIILSR